MIRKHIRFLSTVLLFWFGQYIFSPFFMPYLNSLEITATLAGLISSIYGFSQLLLRIPFGVSADKLRSHKFFMLIGFIFLALAGVMLYTASHPATLVLARFFSGAAASTWVSFTVFFTSRFPAKDTGKAVSTVIMVNNFGILLSYGLGTLIFDRVGIHNLFLISVAVSVVGAILIISLPEEKKTSQTPITMKSVFFTIKNKNLLNYSLMAALLHTIIFATAMSFTANYAKTLGATGVQLGILSISYNGIGVLGSYWMSTNASRKISDRTKMVFSFMLLGISCFTIPNSNHMVMIYAAQVFGGIGRAILLSLTMEASLRQIPTELKSTAMGTYQSLYSIGMTLGPVIMGFALDYTGSYRISYYLIGILSILGVAWGFGTARSKKEATM